MEKKFTTAKYPAWAEYQRRYKEANPERVKKWRATYKAKRKAAKAAMKEAALASFLDNDGQGVKE